MANERQVRTNSTLSILIHQLLGGVGWGALNNGNAQSRLFCPCGSTSPAESLSCTHRRGNRLVYEIRVSRSHQG